MIFEKKNQKKFRKTFFRKNFGKNKIWGKIYEKKIFFGKKIEKNFETSTSSNYT